jgi:hypothetical protein
MLYKFLFSFNTLWYPRAAVDISCTWIPDPYQLQEHLACNSFCTNVNDIDVSREWYLQEKWYLTSNLWDCQQAELVRISHGASKISQVIMESSLKNRNLRQIALIVAVKIFNYTHWERDGDTVKVNAWLFSYNKLFIKVIYRVLSNLSAVVTVSPGTPFLSTSTRPLYPEKKKNNNQKNS